MTHHICHGHYKAEVRQLSEAYSHGGNNFSSSDEASSSSSSLPSPQPRARVYVNISFKFIREFIDCLDDGSTIPLGRCPSHRQQRLCRCDLYEFLERSETTYLTLLEELSSLEIDQIAAHELINDIIFKGRELIVSNKEYNMDRSVVVLLHVEIEKVQHYWMHYERYLTHRAMRESMEEFERSNCGMVPASESSLKELLKRVSVAADSEENCSVCLEKIEGGTHCMNMPCSHVFHEDCIVKWLKQSHYCPVCRYEMPINN